jgi:hypothetical protein
MSCICRETIKTGPPDRREILRYAACPAPADFAVLEECLDELLPLLQGRVCYAVFPLRRDGETLDLGFARTESRALAERLDGCTELLLFAATVGIGPDRLIAKYGRLSPSRALLCQAIGAERVEALCEAFCAERAAEYEGRGLALRPRFSPGYGDLPLALQTEIFRALDCERQIGLTLNRSLLMSPSKSVTALAGIGPRTEEGSLCAAKGCAACEKTDCPYRAEQKEER